MSKARSQKQTATLVRQAILEGAIRAFARVGYEAVTMKDIAEASGYTAPALYHYFPGKEEIIEALLDHVHEAFLATLDEPMLDSMTFPQRVEMLLRRQIDVAARHREAFELFNTVQAQCSGVRSSKRKECLVANFERYQRRLAKWMGESATKQDLGGRPPEVAAFFFWSICMGFRMRAVIAGRESIDNWHEQVPLVIDLFLNGVRGSRRNQSERASE
jgi:AcrR family transcriptional regulator